MKTTTRKLLNMTLVLTMFIGISACSKKEDTKPSEPIYSQEEIMNDIKNLDSLMITTEINTGYLLTYNFKNTHSDGTSTPFSDTQKSGSDIGPDDTLDSILLSFTDTDELLLSISVENTTSLKVAEVPLKQTGDHLSALLAANKAFLTKYDRKFKVAGKGDQIFQLNNITRSLIQALNTELEKILNSLS